MKKIFAMLHGFAVVMAGYAIGFAIIKKDFDSIVLAIVCILLLVSLFFNDYLYGWKGLFKTLHGNTKKQIESSIKRSNRINSVLTEYKESGDIGLIDCLIMEMDEEAEVLADNLFEYMKQEDILK